MKIFRFSWVFEHKWQFMAIHCCGLVILNSTITCRAGLTASLAFFSAYTLNPQLSTLIPQPSTLYVFTISFTPISPYLCPHAHPRKRSLNRAALEEVLKHESLDRAVCGAQSASTTKCSRPNGTISCSRWFCSTSWAIAKRAVPTAAKLIVTPKGKRSAAKPSSQFSIQCSLTLFFRRNYIKNSAPRAAFWSFLTNFVRNFLIITLPPAAENQINQIHP